MPHSDTEVRLSILATLAKIPYGKISSYGEIAKLSGQRGKARYVAYILKNLPDDSDIPWHRVINSQGKISFPNHSEKYRQQASLLLNEGITTPLSKKSRQDFSWLGD